MPTGGARGKLKAAVEAYYWARPTAAEMRSLGLSAEHYREPVVDVWPECWLAMDVFIRYASQWRMGFGGPVGLDYGVIHHALDRLDLSQADYDETLDQIRVIESEALEQLTKS